MYAVIEVGGRQWRVTPGASLEINRVSTAVGALHTMERVLLAQDGAELKIGRPYVEGAQVVCEVLEHRRGPKVITYRFRRRENWRKTIGHRQNLTRLLVKEIHFGAADVPKAQPAQEPTPSRAARRPASNAAARASARPARAAGKPAKPAPKRGATHGA